MTLRREPLPSPQRCFRAPPARPQENRRVARGLRLERWAASLSQRRSGAQKGLRAGSLALYWWHESSSGTGGPGALGWSIQSASLLVARRRKRTPWQQLLYFRNAKVGSQSLLNAAAKKNQPELEERRAVVGCVETPSASSQADRKGGNRWCWEGWHYSWGIAMGELAP